MGSGDSFPDAHAGATLDALSIAAKIALLTRARGADVFDDLRHDQLDSMPSGFSPAIMLESLPLAHAVCRCNDKFGLGVLIL